MCGDDRACKKAYQQTGHTLEALLALLRGARRRRGSDRGASPLPPHPSLPHPCCSPFVPLLRILTPSGSDSAAVLKALCKPTRRVAGDCGGPVPAGKVLAMPAEAGAAAFRLCLVVEYVLWGRAAADQSVTKVTPAEGNACWFVRAAADQSAGAVSYRRLKQEIDTPGGIVSLTISLLKDQRSLMSLFA